MKFGFSMPNTVRVKALTQAFEVDVTGPDQVAMARRAEELGYDVIPIPEHFVVPNTHVELSGPHYFHSTVAQAFIAGATQRIRVMSTVTLLPLQHPVILAKALSTADWMSNGRITVTFGVGWDAEEFKILGVRYVGAARPEHSANRAPTPADRHAADFPAKIFRRIVEQPTDTERIERHPEERLGSGDAGAGETGERVDLLDGIANGFPVRVGAVALPGESRRA